MLRVITDHTGPAQGVTVWHFDGDLTTPGIEQDVADATQTFWTAMRPLVVNDQTMTVQPEVLEVDVATGQTTGVASVTTTPAVGTSTADQLPQLAQALVRWRTGFYSSGRELRGRTFLPGLSVASTTSTGAVIAATITAINNAAAALLANPEANFGVWSAKYGTFASATSATTWNEWASMRSRRE